MTRERAAAAIMNAFHAMIENKGPKELFAKRFKKLFPEQRLLAVQLNGFSHSVYFDEGTKDSSIKSLNISFCMPEGNFDPRLRLLFLGFEGHHQYQNNAKEIVYVTPEAR